MTKININGSVSDREGQQQRQEYKADGKAVHKAGVCGDGFLDVIEVCALAAGIAPVVVFCGKAAHGLNG